MVASAAVALLLLARTAAGQVAGRPVWPGDVALATGPGDQGVALFAAPGVQAVSDAAQGVIILWSDTSSGQIHAQRLNAAGQALWGAGGVAVAPGASDQFDPRAVADGLGGVFVAWLDDRNGACGPGVSSGCNVAVQHLDGQGHLLFAAQGVVASPLTPTQSASGISNQGLSGIGIASDGQGGVIVAWEDGRDVCCTFFAQRLDPTGAPLWSARGTQVSPTPTEVFGPVGVAPAVIGDRAGGALIGWLNVQVDPLTQSPPIVFQHLDENGQPLLAQGPVTAFPPLNLQYSVVDDGTGAALIAAQIAGGDGLSDIGVARVNPDGTLPWGRAPVPVSTASGTQMQVQAAADGSGGVLVVWADFPSFNLWAQHVDATGTPRWTANGVLLTPDIPGARLPTIVSDDVGGAIVVWQDCRYLITPLEQYTCDFGRDLYAQRLSAAGVPMWPAGGIAVTTGPGNQGLDYGSQNIPSIALAKDGASGAFVAWPDGRAVPCPITVGMRDCEVYAQHITDQDGPGPASDIAVAVTVSPDPPTAMSSATFTITVTNHGPNDAQSVNLVHTLATSALFTSLTTSQGECELDSLCSLGRLASGSSAVVTYVVQTLQGGQFNDTFTAYAAEPDPDSSNNSASYADAALAADFTLAASPAAQTISAGSTASYTITATTLGGAAFTGGFTYQCSGLPAASSCEFSSSGVVSGSTASASLAIGTNLGSPGVAGIATFGLLAGALLPIRVRRRRAHLFAALALGAALVSGCGGGGSDAGTGSGPRTPAGDYTITVTAKCAGVSRTTTVQLSVH